MESEYSGGKRGKYIIYNLDVSIAGAGRHQWPAILMRELISSIVTVTWGGGGRRVCEIFSIL